MNIQKISAIVLLVVLIITMIVVYGMLYYSNNNLSFPPKINKCPDKMTYIDGKCQNAAGVDSAFAPYETGSDVCDATLKQARVGAGNWDGITNANCD